MSCFDNALLHTTLLFSLTVFIAISDITTPFVHADDYKQISSLTKKSEDTDNANILSFAKDNFSYNISSLLFAHEQLPKKSSQNPENAFLKLYRYSLEFHLRPDLYFSAPYINSSIKPRITTYNRWGKDKSLDNKTDSQTEGFITEWLFQFNLHPEIFISYGKENLQWGPSFLSSPSNPFFTDNGKDNSKIEIEGKDFLRLVYIPNDWLTLTWASNIDESDDKAIKRNFSPIHALKSELTGESYSLGIITSKAEKGRFRLGSYGQATLSDALILYYDGVGTKGTDTLYPEIQETHPVRGEFKDKNKNSSRIFTTILTGGSYTFMSGPTLSLEYLYNSTGYDSSQTKRYYTLRKTASENYSHTILSPLSKKNLADSFDPQVSFQRRHYFMLQYQQREIKDMLDVILRYTHNIEDHSGSFVSIVEWGVSDQIQLFNINNINLGHSETEYGSIYRLSIMLGLEYFF